jgi:hypothetical protein
MGHPTAERIEHLFSAYTITLILILLQAALLRY